MGTKCISDYKRVYVSAKSQGRQNPTVPIHYDPLMISQKEAPRPWVLHRKLAMWFEFPFNLALQNIMGASWVLPSAAAST